MPKYGKLAPVFPVGLQEFKQYAVSALPKPPVTVNYYKQVSTWPMDDNDQLGDCVMAGISHCLQLWNAEVKAADAVPTTDQIDSLYLQLSPQDQGLVESDTLKRWQTIGLWNNKIAAYAPVNTHNITDIKVACLLFGAVFCGIQVPENAQTQFTQGTAWTLESGWQHQPIEGGHCVPIVGYDKNWLYLVTWGSLWKMSYDWWHVYGDEAWAIIPQAFVEKHQGADPLINFNALYGDLNRLNGAPQKTGVFARICNLVKNHV